MREANIFDPEGLTTRCNEIFTLAFEAAHGAISENETSLALQLKEMRDTGQMSKEDADLRLELLGSRPESQAKKSSILSASALEVSLVNGFSALCGFFYSCWLSSRPISRATTTGLSGAHTRDRPQHVTLVSKDSCFHLRDCLASTTLATSRVTNVLDDFPTNSPEAVKRPRPPQGNMPEANSSGRGRSS